MSWAWLRDVTGAGAMTAPALAFAEREIGPDPGRGAPTLLALARAIDAFASRETSTQEEARFVEGGGALFAVVLLAHVGEGAHASRDGVHRLRLGRAGFVDPFAAVERALTEGPAKRVLVDATRLAEAEADGTGPIARVACAFEAMLRARGDGQSITERFDRLLFVGEIEIDLTRTIEATVGETDTTLARNVAKLIDMLPGGRGVAVDRAEAELRLLPRLVGSTFDAPGALVLLPLALDVRIALVLAYDGRAKFVSASDLARWSMSASDASAVAVANLESRVRAARLTRLDAEEGTVWIARTGDGLDSARLLSPVLRRTLSESLGARFLVAVPHRDVLLACAHGDDALAAVFGQRVADASARAPHAISARVYVSDGDALHVL